MLTPQEISEKGFVKAVFGGYDMQGVDDFLETVSTDYNALYKENAILKGKLKVLVEKVEEYRSTEDAMRMALLTAQRMGEEITVEANRTKDEMLQNTENEIKEKLSDTAKRVADEETRLAVATKETAKFIELSQAIMKKHSEFLDKLETARRAVKTVVKPANEPGQPSQDVKAQRSAKQVQIQPAKEAPPVKPAPAPQVRTVQPVSQPVQPELTATAHDFEIEDIASQIGSAVERMTDDFPSQSQDDIHSYEPDDPHPSLFEDDDGSVKLYSPESELENTSPRPKFDFDDLKFGANFDSDD